MQNSHVQSLKKLSEPILWRLEVLLESLGIEFIFRELRTSVVRFFKNPRKSQLAFISDFEQWLTDGANMVVACEKIAMAARQSGARNSFNERAAVAISGGLQSGKSVALSMKGYFDDEIIDIFNIGEQTNTLGELLSHYMKNLDDIKELRATTIKRLLYPLMIVSGLLSTFYIIGVQGVPQLLEITTLERLPSLSRDLVDLSLHIAQFGMLYSFITIMFIITVALAQSRYIGPLRPQLDRFFPPFIIYKSLVANNVIKRIALLTRSGISLSETISILLRNSAPYERSYYELIIRKLGNSTGSIAEYLDVGLLNNEIFHRLQALSSLEGEAAKYHAIFVAGDRSGKAAKKSIVNSSRLLVFLIWVSVAILGSVFAFGVLDLIFNIDQLIRK